MILQGHSAFPRQEIIPSLNLRLGFANAGGVLDHLIKQSVSARFHAFLAVNDGTRVKVNDSEKASAVFELLEIFTTGAMGLPVGVPRPVEKRIMFAPAPAMAVVDSTPFPAVQSKDNPGFVTHPG